MYVPPEFKILAIDPGANMGISIISINLVEQEMMVLDSFTVTSSQLMSMYNDTEIMVLGKKPVLKHEICRLLTRLIDIYDIDHVIYEAAYNSVSLVAYDSLVFYGNCIMEAVRHCDSDVTYESVPPSRVKTSIGVKGNSGDKSAIYNAVKEADTIKLGDGVDLDELTEHAIDSIAIGHSAFVQFYSLFRRRRFL